MEFFTEFINTYGGPIFDAIIAAVIAVIGAGIKKIYTKYINDKTKADVVKTCVRAVEQIYVDLHGQEKLDKCIESVCEILEEKGIAISDLEVRMRIEDAVQAMNREFSSIFDDLPNAGAQTPTEEPDEVEETDEGVEDPAPDAPIEDID